LERGPWWGTGISKRREGATQPERKAPVSQEGRPLGNPGTWEGPHGVHRKALTFETPQKADGRTKPPSGTGGQI